MAKKGRFDYAEDAPKKKLSMDDFKDALKIFRFIRPYRWHFFLGIVLLFVSSLTFMGFPYLAGLMIDIAQGESELPYSLGEVGLGMVAIFIVQGFVSYARVMLFAVVSEKGIADVRKAVYRKLIAQPVVFFEENRVGEIVSRLTSDIERLYNAFSITLAEFIRQVIILVSGLTLLGLTAPKLALIMIATFPVIIICAIFFGRHIRKLSKERQSELAVTNTILDESIQAIFAVKAFTNEFFESMRYGKSVDTVVTVSMKYAKGRALFSVFIVSVLFGALFFIIWTGATMIQDPTNPMTSGGLVSFVAYTAIIGGSIAGLGNFYPELMGAIGATDRIKEILDAEPEIELKNWADYPLDAFEGKIEYKGIHFNYPTRTDVPVLKGVSFNVNAGEKVALVGTSGSGKSTIVQLLMRFYETSEGAISIDGKKLEEIPIETLRRNIAIVPQEVLLFGGTIMENILYGKPNATLAEVRDAAKKANALDFIDSFPEGMETMVGERGIKLSGGQRQRIAIARAILKDPVILLLDEATSSLDAESEKVVQEALDKLMKGRTSIIIAHRLATIREVDCIYVLDSGKIIESGTHDELSAQEDGAYQSLAKLQFESAKVEA